MGMLVVAAPVKEYTVTIRNHRFVPAEITIPAKTKVKLIVVNEDAIHRWAKGEGFFRHRNSIALGGVTKNHVLLHHRNRWGGFGLGSQQNLLPDFAGLFGKRSQNPIHKARGIIRCNKRESDLH